MPQNGQINEKFGVYKTVCCDFEIVIAAGAIFPYCPDHRRPTIWELLPYEDMTQLTDKKESKPKRVA